MELARFTNCLFRRQALDTISVRFTARRCNGDQAALRTARLTTEA
jgi:hypothetical protein